MTDIASNKKHSSLHRISRDGGYTIIEVLIFLAVSSLLVVLALSRFSGQQERTQFTQGARDLEFQMQDIINDLNSGYYPSSNNLECTEVLGSVSLVTTTTVQGTNKDCIFLGRVINFTDGDSYRVFTVAGLRLSGGTQSKTLDEAKPTAIAPSSTNPTRPSLTEIKTLPFGIRVAWVRASDAGGASMPSTIGLFSALSKYQQDTDGNIVSGTQQVDLIPIPGTLLSTSSLQIADAINGVDGSTPKNPTDGIAVCLNGGNGQHAILLFGGQNKTLRTDMIINEGNCPA